MKRNYFIGLTSLGVAAVAIPSWYYLTKPVYDVSLFFPKTLTSIWDRPTMVFIGQEYLDKYPIENSQRKLIDLLLEGQSPKMNNIGETLALKIEKDYQEKRIVTIDGWLLSRTEARQCALFTLTEIQ
ncbi:hypothetical protein [Pareuzebyella sediminis]|uniref:hypothetical protein n=1 Tax=Pareuzebyella sediminis TaxID=2607998 RepID=UPI0011EEA598|nr:hypothetical protein [Pareuzebyella sediminis]